MRPMGGGTDLIPLYKYKHIEGAVVALGELQELDYIDESPNRLELGAGVKLAGLAGHGFSNQALQVIAEGARAVAGPQLREMGSLGGNLSLETRCIYFNKEVEWRKCLPVCAKAGGGICHAIGRGTDCFAVFSSDTAPVFLALGADITLSSQEGERTVKLNEYYSGDGARPLTRKPDELLTKVAVPLDSLSGPGMIFTDYKKFRLRKAIDFPLASVAGLVCLDADRNIVKLSFALGGVERRPVLVEGLEELITPNSRLSDEGLIEEIAQRCFKAARPVNNLVVSPLQRKRMIKSMTLDMLADFSARSSEGRE